ncbi:MAG: hypothetical protein OEM38_12595 [Gammaproteobacteria bacterium]|nr:hypothetical protein [Gammaproteobacteria bacterium]
MQEFISSAMLQQRIKARIKKLGESNTFISGSFVRTGRKCGNPSCCCATGGEKHPCCLLTSKVKGKTKAVYVPVAMEAEVEQWVNEYRKIKKLLKEIDTMSEQIIKQHVRTKRAVNKNLKFLNQSSPT